MKNNRGSANGDLFWFIGIMAILFLTWMATGGPQRGKNASPFLSAPSSSPISFQAPSSNRSQSVAINSSNNNGDNSNGTTIIAKTNESVYHGKILVDWGNAIYETNAAYEYIILRANNENKSPVNITGWRLEDGGGNQLFDRAGSITQGQKILAYIPSGVSFWRSNNIAPLESIKLNPGDRAYIITGNPPSATPYYVKQSFRINKCFGYINNLPYHNFHPSVYTNCPDPAKEPGIDQLGDFCYRFVRYFPRCHTPVIGWNNINGETIDGRYDLPSYCKDFIKKQFNYDACVAEYSGDKDFYLPEWRIYLGRTWEMYYKEKESVTLYDNQGKIVDQLKTNY